MSELFDRWYAVYPNKKSKGAAIKAWDKINPDEALTERMIISIQIQKRWRVEAKKAGEFVPDWKMPATWLNGTCWEDEVGSFQDLRERQNSAPVVCSGGGKYCTGKAVVKGAGDIWLCTWCFSERHADMGPLREGFKRHGLGRKEGETTEEWRKRLIATAREAAARFGSRQRGMA